MTTAGSGNVARSLDRMAGLREGPPGPRPAPLHIRGAAEPCRLEAFRLHAPVASGWASHHVPSRTSPQGRASGLMLDPVNGPDDAGPTSLRGGAPGGMALGILDLYRPIRAGCTSTRPAVRGPTRSPASTMARRPGRLERRPRSSRSSGRRELRRRTPRVPLRQQAADDRRLRRGLWPPRTCAEQGDGTGDYPRWPPSRGPFTISGRDSLGSASRPSNGPTILATRSRGYRASRAGYGPSAGEPTVAGGGRTPHVGRRAGC